MRIQIFHNQYQIRGGEDIMVEREANLLRSYAHEVSVESWNNENIQSIYSQIMAAKNCVYSTVSKVEAKKRIEKFKPDICHVHNFFPLLTPSIFDACNEMGIPVVFTVHNYRLFCANGLFLRKGSPCETCLTKSHWNAVRYACYRNSRLATFPVANMIGFHRENNTWNTKVNSFIALNEFAKSKFVAGGIQSSRIYVRYNYSEDLGVRTEKDNYAIYFGRVSREKGISTLTSAWKDHFPKLYVVGEGAIEKSWEGNRNIQFIKGLSREDALAYLKKARFFILPTECYEGGTPLSVIEALSFGIPVLVSRIGGLKEIIEHGKNGFYFEPGNRKKLTECIEDFLSDPTRERNVSEGARELYLKMFSMEKAYEKLLQIYQKTS